jgi:hypothetical protein
MKLKPILIAMLCASHVHSAEFTCVSDVTAASNVVTVQAQASGMGPSAIQGVAAYVRCVTTACTVVIERNGTAATSTAGTFNAVLDSSLAPAATVAKCWTASDVGTGTVLARDTLIAGESRSFDLSRMKFSGNGTGRNFTIRVTPTSSSQTIVNVMIDQKISTGVR